MLKNFLISGLLASSLWACNSADKAPETSGENTVAVPPKPVAVDTDKLTQKAKAAFEAATSASDPEAGYAAMTEAMQSFSADTDQLITVGDAAYDLRKYDEAAEHYANAKASMTDDARATTKIKLASKLSRSCSRTSDLGCALEQKDMEISLLKSEGLNNRLPSAYRAKAGYQQRSGDTDGALATLATGLASATAQSRFSDAANNRYDAGLILVKAEQIAQACTTLRNGLRFAGQADNRPVAEKIAKARTTHCS